MKKNHPFLKIAGVKNIDEFYQKFPTEAAFMKKHGKALKKAQVGTMIGAQPETSAYKPISYNNLASGAQSSVYGISPEEQARQEALASQQAIASASGQKGGGLADVLGSIDPAMISQLVGGAKNGKKLKKAVNGFEGLIKPPAMPKVNPVNLAKTKGFGLSKMEDIPASTDRGFDYAGAFKQMPGALASQAGSIVGAIQDISQNKRDLKKQKMYGKVSDLTLQASTSRGEQSKRRYVRPEDQVMQNFRPLGAGTNYLAAANGTMIGGNPTEIQNMYNAPNTMYSDLGYEPLSDSDKVKNFKKGGKLKKAVGGITLDSFSGQGGGLGGMLGSKLGGGSGRSGPGSTIGSTVGGILGMAIPIPGVGSFIGSTLGGIAGGLFDAKGQKQEQASQDKLNQNLQASAFQSGTQNMQMQNKAFMEDGGYVSNNWTPQVIAKFGDVDVSEVRTFAADGMPQYRAGGHLQSYTPPSAQAMYTGKAEYGTQMAMGGDLQVHRGEAETMSYNPYLPDGGETIMFRGPSHDDGGMPVSFGQNGVEVEGGEPAIKMQDGGKEGNLVVYGNMIIPKYGVNEINDPKAKGKKFKHYIADLSKQEAKINKSIEKGVELVNTFDSGDPFDQLAFNSGKAMMMGGDLKLKTIAERKMDTAAVQNAILDTASEMGVESDALAKGKIKYAKANDPYAKFGTKLQVGGKAPVRNNYSVGIGSMLEGAVSLTPNPDTAANAYIPNLTDQINIARFENSKDSKLLDDVRVVAPKSTRFLPNDFVGEGDYVPEEQQIVGQFPMTDYVPIAPVPSLDNLTEDQKRKKRFDFDFDKDFLKLGAIGAASALGQFRPSDVENLDAAQLAPEMMSLATNTLEPVQAQTFQPLLSAPTSFSLQDQLNEITSATRAAERMSAYNPEAAAMIAAQAYNAKNKVLGEQFRMNQAEQQRVMEQNRNVLNDAQLKNLAIFDTQYQRQEQARSTTKQQAIEAMKSIADKTAKNKLENRQLGVMENMYNYRFNRSGQAYNLNNPQLFNMDGALSNKSNTLAEGLEDYYNKAGQRIGTRKSKDSDTGRNGAIVKAIKNL